MTAMHVTGQWEGVREVNGVRGFFPFTHIQFADENEVQPGDEV